MSELPVALNEAICMEIDDITPIYAICTCLMPFYSLVVSTTLIEMGQSAGKHFTLSTCAYLSHVCICRFVSVKIGLKRKTQMRAGGRFGEEWGPRTNIYTAQCTAFAINYRKTIKFAINQMESGNCRLMWNACKATTQTKATIQQHNSATKPSESFFIT